MRSVTSSSTSAALAPGYWVAMTAVLMVAVVTVVLSLAKNASVWLVALVYHITVCGGVGCSGDCCGGCGARDGGVFSAANWTRNQSAGASEAVDSDSDWVRT